MLKAKLLHWIFSSFQKYKGMESVETSPERTETVATSLYNTKFALCKCEKTNSLLQSLCRLNIQLFSLFRTAISSNGKEGKGIPQNASYQSPQTNVLP